MEVLVGLTLVAGCVFFLIWLFSEFKTARAREQQVITEAVSESRFKILHQSRLSNYDYVMTIVDTETGKEYTIFKSSTSFQLN